jgi:signal transduction histidine kinase
MRGEAGRTSGFVATIQDRTEHVVMERHIRRADKLAALGELSAGLAHEIKNPLTAIKGFSQLVPERLSDHDFMGKFSRMLGNELMRIDELTERLLTFARPNVGDMRVVTVADLVEDAILLAKYQLEKAGIVHEIETCSPVPEVKGSPGRLSQVFLNIIINSLHAMEQGGRLLVRVSRRFYRIPERGGIRAVLWVDFTDTGNGIAPEHIDRIFNPFFTTRESGTGLGLAISYRIIEEHGGVMEVRSTVGEGDQNEGSAAGGG